MHVRCDVTKWRRAFLLWKKPEEKLSKMADVQIQKTTMGFGLFSSLSKGKKSLLLLLTSNLSFSYSFNKLHNKLWLLAFRSPLRDSNSKKLGDDCILSCNCNKHDNIYLLTVVKKNTVEVALSNLHIFFSIKVVLDSTLKLVSDTFNNITSPANSTIYGRGLFWVKKSQKEEKSAGQVIPLSAQSLGWIRHCIQIFWGLLPTFRLPCIQSCGF